MEMSRREQIDARVEFLKVLYAEGGISEAMLDREIAGLAIERAALNPGPSPDARRDGVDRWERLASAVGAFCHAYLSYQPRKG